MPQIPQSVLEKDPTLAGLGLPKRGKVRNTYDLPGHDDLMLVVATDRISIYDFVLNAQVAQKGAVLTALNHFWTNQVVKGICEHDLVAAGAEIDSYLPEGLRNNPELQKRATVVRKVNPPPQKEDIVRAYLLGSGKTSYLKTGKICGHRLPPGIKEGDLLPYPIYTPTDKAEKGHDVHLAVDDVIAKHGHWCERIALQVFSAAAQFALKRGIIIADTKFEIAGKILADEKLTPDSSRFWGQADYEKARRKGKLPDFLDKQWVRNWGQTVGINKRDPLIDADVEFVHSQIVPEHVLKLTTKIYRYIFWRLTGMTLEEYQAKEMGIKVEKPLRRIAVVIGSESDMKQTTSGMLHLANHSVGYDFSVISCHRNPKALREHVAWLIENGFEAIVAGAGKLAGLPGDLKALLCAEGRSDIPVIGVGFKGDTEKADLAAKLGIEELPETPVEMDERGHAYFGPEGFTQACQAATNHEFLPKGFTAKDAMLHLPV